MPKKRLLHFETLARELVEGSFSRLFGGRLDRLNLATKLAQAVEDSQRAGRPADTFVVRVNPIAYEDVLHEHPHAAQQLEEYLSSLMGQAELVRPKDLTVELTPDNILGRWQAQIETHHRHELSEETQARRVDWLDDGLQALKSLDAYLIVNGQRHVPLDRPIVTLGRRMDSDVVIDSPSVSRQHAQIRWRYGRFVVYDLGSRAGVMINDQPVSESVLEAGDVIRLSDVAIIYGEGWTELTGNRPKPAAETEGGTTLAMPRDEVAGET